MQINNELIQAIKDIRYAGEHPLLQYDLIDAKTLQDVLNAQSIYPNAWQVAKVLQSLGMRRLGLYSIEGFRAHLWTCLPPQEITDILRLAAYRVSTNATRLHTELLIESGTPVPPAPPKPFRPRLTPLEWGVLDLRLKGHPPRRIAALLNSNPWAIYGVSQSLKMKLCVAHLRNLDELREKAANADQMSDPAFQ